MRTYTTDEARKIAMNCAKIYAQNLLGKTFLIIYRDRKDNRIKHLEVHFREENYQHLTGIELTDKNGAVRKHTARLFFKKCLTNKLSKDEIQFKKDGTTHLKLTALPAIMTIQKVTKIAGEYNGNRPYLVADKLIGNINFCLGLKRIGEMYAPVSALMEDIKVLTDYPSQVLAIFSKEYGENKYQTVRHVSKGINLHNIVMPKEIQERISLSHYIPK